MKKYIGKFEDFFKPKRLIFGQPLFDDLDSGRPLFDEERDDVVYPDEEVIEKRVFTSKKKYETIPELWEQQHFSFDAPDARDAIDQLTVFFGKEEEVERVAIACDKADINVYAWNNSPDSIKDFELLLPRGSAREKIAAALNNPNSPDYDNANKFYNFLKSSIKTFIKDHPDQFGDYIERSKKALEYKKVETSIQKKKTVIIDSREQLDNISSNMSIGEVYHNLKEAGIAYDQWEFYGPEKADRLAREMATAGISGNWVSTLTTNWRRPDTDQTKIEAKEDVQKIVQALKNWENKLIETSKKTKEMSDSIYRPIKEAGRNVLEAAREGTSGEKLAIYGAIGLFAYLGYKAYTSGEGEEGKEGGKKGGFGKFFKSLIKWGIPIAAFDLLLGKATGVRPSDYLRDAIKGDELDNSAFLESMKKLGFTGKKLETAKKGFVISNTPINELIEGYIIAKKSYKKEIDPNLVGANVNQIKGKEIYEIMDEIVTKAGGIENFEKKFANKGLSLAEVVLMIYNPKEVAIAIGDNDEKLDNVLGSDIDAIINKKTHTLQIFGFNEDYKTVKRNEKDGGGYSYFVGEPPIEFLADTKDPEQSLKNSAAREKLEVRYRTKMESLLIKKMKGKFDKTKLEWTDKQWIYQMSVEGDAQYGVPDNDKHKIFVKPTTEGVDVEFYEINGKDKIVDLNKVKAEYLKIKVKESLEKTFDFLKLQGFAGNTQSLDFDLKKMELLPAGKVKAEVKGLKFEAVYDQIGANWNLLKMGPMTDEFAKAKAEILRSNDSFRKIFKDFGNVFDMAPEKFTDIDYKDWVDIFSYLGPWNWRPSGTVIETYFEQLTTAKRKEIIEDYEKGLKDLKNSGTAITPAVIKKVEEDTYIKAEKEVQAMNKQMIDRINDLYRRKEKMKKSEFWTFTDKVENMNYESDSFKDEMRRFKTMVYFGDGEFNLEGIDRSDLSYKNHEAYLALRNYFLKYVGKYSNTDLNTDPDAKAVVERTFTAFERKLRELQSGKGNKPWYELFDKITVEEVHEAFKNIK